MTAHLLASLLATSLTTMPSIEELNSHPETFDGQVVTITGWVVIDTEKRYIVAVKDGYTMWKKGATCLSIIDGGSLDEHASVFNGKLVRITGVFRSDVNRDGEVRLSLCGITALDLQSKDVSESVRLVR